MCPASPTDTIPDTATWDWFPHGSEGDFARLIPSSNLAREVFNELVQKLAEDPSYLPHARRFIHFEDSDLTEEDEVSSNPTSPKSTTVTSRKPVCGYYRLNMDLQPSNLALGWVVGSGRKDLGDSAVDLVLTTKSQQHHVRGRHCRLRRNLDTGILFIQSDARRIVINGKDILQRKEPFAKQPEQDYQIAIHDRTGITIGDLSYLLEFPHLPEDTHLKQLQVARRHGNPQQSSQDDNTPSLLLSPTPKLKTYEYFGYVVYPVTHGGATSTVALAYSKANGKPVVLKRIKRSRGNFYQVQDEIFILRRLDHEHVCKLVEVIDTSTRNSTRDFNPNQNEFDDVGLVLSPHAPTMLAAIVSTWKTQIGDGQTREGFLKGFLTQCCSGLDHVHKRGFIHRDIKPDNLGLTSLNPLRLVILDFGHAEPKSENVDHMKGTIRYLAPEIIRLKEGKSSESFDEKVDSWSLGITLLELLLTRRLNCYASEAAQPVVASHITHALETQSDDRLESHLNVVRLLEWEPLKRASMSDVLQDIQ